MIVQLCIDILSEGLVKRRFFRPINGRGSPHCRHLCLNDGNK
jgi:hypothetical protein